MEKSKLEVMFRPRVRKGCQSKAESYINLFSWLAPSQICLIPLLDDGQSIYLTIFLILNPDLGSRNVSDI